MRITELDGDGGTIARALRRHYQAQPARTGLHLSDITNDIKQRMEKGKRADLPEPTVHLLWTIGIMWEEFCASWLTQQYTDWEKPAPVTVEGIICSADGISRRSHTIDEMKATWAYWTSIDEFFASPKGFDYTLRVAGYCYAYGCDRGRVHINFIRGVRGGSPMPVSKTFYLKFEVGEIQQQWRMLRQHAVDQGWL